jgi:hypothetical protein
MCMPRLLRRYVYVFVDSKKFDSRMAPMLTTCVLRRSRRYCFQLVYILARHKAAGRSKVALSSW